MGTIQAMFSTLNPFLSVGEVSNTLQSSPGHMYQNNRIWKWLIMFQIIISKLCSFHCFKSLEYFGKHLYLSMLYDRNML